MVQSLVIFIGKKTLSMHSGLCQHIQWYTDVIEISRCNTLFFVCSYTGQLLALLTYPLTIPHSLDYSSRYYRRNTGSTTEDLEGLEIGFQRWPLIETIFDF